MKIGFILFAEEESTDIQFEAKATLSWHGPTQKARDCGTIQNS
jgi:hypothetical protein